MLSAEEFARKYEELEGHLYGIAYKRVGNPEDAEDLVQETCVKAWANIASYEPKTNFSAWVTRILVNNHINLYRARMRHGELEREHMPAIEWWNHSKQVLPADRIVELKSEMHPKIVKAMEDMPDDYTKTLRMREIEDKSYLEIAESMDCPVGTVMSRLYRARRKFKENLAPHMDVVEERMTA